MTWRFILSDAASKDLNRLDKQTVTRVYDGIHRLLASLEASVSIIPGARPLINWDPPAWRLRVGDWRVLYSKESDKRLLTILRILHRREAYKR